MALSSSGPRPFARRRGTALPAPQECSLEGGTFCYGPREGGFTAPIADGDTEAAGGPADGRRNVTVGGQAPHGRVAHRRPRRRRGPVPGGRTGQREAGTGAAGAPRSAGTAFHLGDKKAWWMETRDDCTAA